MRWIRAKVFYIRPLGLRIPPGQFGLGDSSALIHRARKLSHQNALVGFLADLRAGFFPIKNSPAQLLADWMRQHLKGRSLCKVQYKCSALLLIRLDGVSSLLHLLDFTFNGFYSWCDVRSWYWKVGWMSLDECCGECALLSKWCAHSLTRLFYNKHAPKMLPVQKERYKKKWEVWLRFKTKSALFIAGKNAIYFRLHETVMQHFWGAKNSQIFFACTKWKKFFVTKMLCVCFPCKRKTRPTAW